MSTPEGKEETIDAAKQREQDIQDEKNKDREKYPSSLEPIKPVIIPIPIKASDNVRKTTPKAVKPSTPSKISTAEKRDVLPSKKKETKPQPDTSKDVSGQSVHKADPPTIAKKATVYKDNVQKQSVRSDENLQVRLHSFLRAYCNAYESKQLDRFTTFFTPDAMEKGIPFSSQLPKYRRIFEKIDSMDYRIDLRRYSVQEDSGLIRIEGVANRLARLTRDTGVWREISTDIFMELIDIGDSFRVKRLDY